MITTYQSRLLPAKRLGTLDRERKWGLANGRGNALRTAAARRSRVLLPGLALLAFALAPAVVCQLLAPPPKQRSIHIESFRYGKQPAVIRCNRGDELHLTFEARDTGHSFFLEEFDLDVKITPGSREVEVFRASDPTAPPRIAREVVLRAEYPGWRQYLVAKSQYRCHVWCGPMHAFEQGKLIIGPNTLLFAGLGLVVGIPVVGWLRLRGVFGKPVLLHRDSMEGWDLLRRWPWLKRFLKRREFQFVWVFVGMLLLYVILLALLFGTKVAGRNLGSMLTWIVWLFVLTAVLTPLGGRIWCLACPLPVLGDILQRRAITGVRAGSTGRTNNRFFGLNLPWPSWLANDWPRVFTFLVLGTFSTVLVAVPRVSGWVVLTLVLLSMAMAMIWELRAFCRYVCPISAFVGLYGRVGKLALRVADGKVCQRCKTHSCQKGSKLGWACPFGLCASEIRENTDCGLCTECFKTCPHDNITLRWRPFAWETAIRGAGEAWLAMGMLVLAAAYTVTHLGHWPFLRDCVNVIDKGNWHLFGVYAAVLWTAALAGLPAVMLLAAGTGKRLASSSLARGARGTMRGTVKTVSIEASSHSDVHLEDEGVSTWHAMLASCGALIPLGLAAWIAFVVPMFMVNVSFIWQALSDPFGWGWNLLGAANTPWHQLWPSAIPWIQVGCILLGLGYSLRNGWRIWLELAPSPHAALRGMLPLGLLLVGITGWLVWFYAN